MTAANLLAGLRARGVALHAEGTRLRGGAPAGVLTPELRAALAEHKAEVLALLRAEAVAALPDTAREAFEERAAIMQFDGGMSRAEAERQACEEVTHA